MASKLSTQNAVGRGDTFKLHPDDVVLGRNTRIAAIPDLDEKVTSLAVSIAVNGQKTPAVGHRNESQQFVLDGGFTRLLAVQKLRAGFEAIDPADGQKRFFQDPDARLTVIVDNSVKNGWDAFLAGIIENQKIGVTDVQEAEGDAVMREEFGKVNAEIARLRGYTNQNRTDKLQTLLELPDYLIDLVNDGKLAMSVAVDNLRDVPEPKRKLVIEKATDDKGRVQGARVRDLLRELADGHEIDQYETGDDGESKAGGTGKSKAATGGGGTATPGRTVKNLKDFVANYRESDDANTDASELLDVLARWITGELKTDRKFLDILDRVKLKN